MSFAYWDAEAKRRFGELDEEEQFVIKSRLRKICLHYRIFGQPPEEESIISTSRVLNLTIAVLQGFVTLTFQCEAGVPVFVSWKRHLS